MKKLIVALPLLALWGCGSNPPADAPSQASAPSPGASTPSAETPTPTTSAKPAPSSMPTTLSKPTKPSSPAPVDTSSVTSPADSSGGKDSYLPMANGNTWVYDAEVTIYDEGATPPPSQHLELMFKLSDVRRVGNRLQGKLSVLQGDQLIDNSEWQEGSDGIFQVSSGKDDVLFDHPEPVMMFPFKANEVIPWQNKGRMPNGLPGNQSGKTVTMDAPEIDTAISTVAGIASVATSDFTYPNGKGSASTTTYFQKGVGIVRLDQTVRQNKNINKTTLRMKSWALNG